MLKPHQICMIRGVPPHQAGSDCNGKIVEILQPFPVEGHEYWSINPPLHSRDGLMYSAYNRVLYPLEDPDALQLNTKLEQYA